MRLKRKENKIALNYIKINYNKQRAYVRENNKEVYSNLYGSCKHYNHFLRISG